VFIIARNFKNVKYNQLNLDMMLFGGTAILDKGCVSPASGGENTANNKKILCFLVKCSVSAG
jgi:hypothetical protein